MVDDKKSNEEKEKDSDKNHVEDSTSESEYSGANDYPGGCTCNTGTNGPDYGPCPIHGR